MARLAVITVRTALAKRRLPAPPPRVTEPVAADADSAEAFVSVCAVVNDVTDFDDGRGDIGLSGAEDGGRSVIGDIGVGEDMLLRKSPYSLASRLVCLACASEPPH